MAITPNFIYAVGQTIEFLAEINDVPAYWVSGIILTQYNYTDGNWYVIKGISLTGKWLIEEDKIKVKDLTPKPLESHHEVHDKCPYCHQPILFSITIHD